MTRESAHSYMWKINDKNPLLIKWANHVIIRKEVDLLIDKIFDEQEAMEVQIKAKDEEIKRLKEYMEVNDELYLFKLALNETVKELVVKPLVKDIVSNLKKEEK